MLAAIGGARRERRHQRSRLRQAEEAHTALRRALVAAGATDTVTAASSRATRRDERAAGALWVAAGGLIGAAMVHVVVVPEHFREAVSYGRFFTISAVVQVGCAALLLAAPRRWLLQAVVVGSIAVVGLWVVTRTVGLPAGPEQGQAEPVGVLDVLASVCEITTAGVAAFALRRHGVARR